MPGLRCAGQTGDTLVLWCTRVHDIGSTHVQHTSSTPAAHKQHRLERMGSSRDALHALSSSAQLATQVTYHNLRLHVLIFILSVP